MPILTPKQMQREAVWNQIKGLLKQNNMNLAPKVSITPGGIGFEIDLVDVDVPKKVLLDGGDLNGRQ